MKVLIVDDEVELVETLVERLRRRNVESVGITDGHEALRRLTEEEFDVVLIDVKMPGMSGLELIELIRARFPAQRVVMLTGHGSAQLAEEGLRHGAHSYLMKPVKLPALIEALRHAAEDEEGARG